jgi:hypothetical protein
MFKISSRAEFVEAGCHYDDNIFNYEYFPEKFSVLSWKKKNVFTSITVEVYFAYRDNTSMNIYLPRKNSMNIA